MAIRYDPNKVLKKVLPQKKVTRLINDRFTLNRTILSMFDDMDFVSKKRITRLALKTIKQYKDRYKEERKLGHSVAEARELALGDKKLLVNRIENAVVYEISQEIQDQYKGEYYKWLPSDADEPDPEHQLNYGKTFQIGDGEMPGERYGCRCGMEILVPEKKLDL